MKRDRNSRKARRAAQVATIVATAATAAGWVMSPEAAHAKKKGAWSVVRTQEPIAGRQTCAVSALDRIGGLRFTRIGIMYAVVENNTEAGLLVGVSTGGRWRLPVGDIVWRVDDKPYRTLRAMDNPEVARTGNPSLMAAEAVKMPGGTSASAAASTNAPATAGAATVAGGTGEALSSGAAAFVETYSKTLDATMERQTAVVAALTATATMASEEAARSMLAEMRAGKSLLFRSQAAAPLYGLPSSNAFAIGQDTNTGRRPIPLDQSFHDGLAACGIGAP